MQAAQGWLTRANCVCLFLIPRSAVSCWDLAISLGGVIYTEALAEATKPDFSLPREQLLCYLPALQSLAKLLHGMAARSSVSCGWVDCRDLKPPPARLCKRRRWTATDAQAQLSPDVTSRTSLAIKSPPPPSSFLNAFCAQDPRGT